MMVKLKKRPKQAQIFVSSFRLDSESFFDSTIQGVKNKLEAKTCNRATYGKAYRRKFVASLMSK